MQRKAFHVNNGSLSFRKLLECISKDIKFCVVTNVGFRDFGSVIWVVFPNCGCAYSSEKSAPLRFSIPSYSNNFFPTAVSHVSMAFRSWSTTGEDISFETLKRMGRFLAQPLELCAPTSRVPAEPFTLAAILDVPVFGREGAVVSSVP
jgi:hypothetical protein